MLRSGAWAGCVVVVGPCWEEAACGDPCVRWGISVGSLRWGFPSEVGVVLRKALGMKIHVGGMPP